jgi:hypothetical protein
MNADKMGLSENRKRKAETGEVKTGEEEATTDNPTTDNAHKQAKNATSWSERAKGQNRGSHR